MGRNHRHHHHGAGEPEGLTKNELLVWHVLRKAEEPLKAYEILDQLKDNGVRAPMTIYRALSGLEAKGVVHKIDGMNSFMLCTHEGPHELQAFLLCNNCQTVTEIDIEGVAAAVVPQVKRTGFEMQAARLEVRGLCKSCALSETVARVAH